jgi:hypothetical protein
MVIGAYALMAQIVTSLYFKVEVELAPARLVDLARFDAMRPYQYRVLVPSIVHAIATVTNASSYQYLTLYQFIEIATVFAVLLAFRSYLSLFLAPARAALLAGAILVPIALIHISCAVARYPSDTPSILFFILGLIALRKRAYGWLYAILAVSTFNRESSALLIVAFAATSIGNVPWRKFVGHCFGLSTVWFAIKLAVNHAFAHNPGSSFEDHTLYNHALVAQFLRGDPHILATILSLAAIGVVIVLGRRLIPSYLLRMLILAPFYAAIMWQFGILDEVRAWNEIVPVMLSPLVVLVSKLADRIDSREQEDAGSQEEAPREIARAA